MEQMFSGIGEAKSGEGGRPREVKEGEIHSALVDGHRVRGGWGGAELSRTCCINFWVETGYLRAEGNRGGMRVFRAARSSEDIGYYVDHLECFGRGSFQQGSSRGSGCLWYIQVFS